MSQALLVLNAGSSSLKFSLFDNSVELPLRLQGQLDGIGTKPHFKVKTATAEVLVDTPCPNVIQQAQALNHLINWLHSHIAELKLEGVGHRVVHGGWLFNAPSLINAEILAQLATFIPLAPLHQPHNLATIQAIAAEFPKTPQVACFDTAFHRGHSKTIEQFALPAEYYQRGVRRYGFHGLSYEFVGRRLKQINPELAAGRVIIAHLGSGASLCALRQGQSIDSSMSFTPLDGLPMGTRCGKLDPGVILYMLQTEGLDSQAIQEILYKQSGLLGISGISNDLRVLLNSTEPSAQEAIDYFVVHSVQEIGALTALLGGLDGLIFTAGIGENAPLIRQQICDQLSWLKIKLDSKTNQKLLGEGCISITDSVPVWVIPTNEERMIAEHTRQLLSANP